MPLPFTKMQGAGNDFVVVSGERPDWSELAIPLCARHFGVGSDGLLVALPSESADVRMRMFNPDGTEDECGNGLRCLALYALEAGMVSGPEFAVETISGVKTVRVDRSEPGRAQVTVGLGQASLAPASVPVEVGGPNALGVPLELQGERLELHTLSTGTAHTVIFRMPDEAAFQRLSPALECHPLFPERTSVLWTEVMDRDNVRVRIWERGVGETLACGTGAAAVAVASHLSGHTGPRIQVHSRGGTLLIEVGDDLRIRKTGPAEKVFDGRFTSG